MSPRKSATRWPTRSPSFPLRESLVLLLYGGLYESCMRVVCENKVRVYYIADQVAELERLALANETKYALELRDLQAELARKEAEQVPQDAHRCHSVYHSTV
jgi:hypothetical protein